jgi:hypothetical protein
MSGANSSLVRHEILHKSTFYYQRIAQTILLVHIHRGLLQHVMVFLIAQFGNTGTVYERYK